MSWQSFVDDRLLATKMVTHAVICGHDGSIWTRPGPFGQYRCNVLPSEVTALLDMYDKPEEMGVCGPVIGNKMYMYLSSFEDKVVRLKAGNGGCHCFKTKQTLILSYYEEPIVHEQAATVTEKLGEYLIGLGY